MTFKTAVRDPQSAHQVDGEIPVADDQARRALWVGRCPSCKRTVIKYVHRTFGRPTSATLTNSGIAATGFEVAYSGAELLWPRFRAVPEVSKYVPKHIAEDIAEAHMTLDVSTKASAALSRRVMQAILHDKQIKAKDLYGEIEEASKQLPSYLGDSLLHAIRRIGNLAAHLKLDTAGQVVDATREEAEWCLELIAGLVDHFYIRPGSHAERMAKLDAKDPNTVPKKKGP
ncbi:DUF4145 domain-containing protein [Sandaracinus amylolyticus]|uniref:DUF4145 domain-containing protein n=1 Tax=Sandaracinus amylolyticus TaxID=927083 RepID=UPI001F23A2C9|nr:DUF4145 domain-containing protein [Sandaracinus amylolyticus]